MPRTFKTISVDLAEHAEAAAAHFEALGYKVRPEKAELGYPYTPTLLCERNPTTILVEVVSVIQEGRIRTWVAYARSSGRDTRIALCLPQGSVLTPGQEARFRDLGVGLYFSVGDRLYEVVVPADLALNVQLPELASQPAKVRVLLGSAYEKFQRSQWREGFEDACQSFESAARRYLKSGLRSKRILHTRGLTGRQIDKMSIGQLADAFGGIQNPSSTDVQTEKTLRAINKDRVALVHHRTKRWTERRLRENVGRHMWTLVEAMKLVKK